MSTLLAPNGITPLQRHLAIAVAAEIVDGGAVAGKPTAKGVARGCWGRDRGLVGFARHVCDSVYGYLEKLGLCLVEVADCEMVDSKLRVNFFARRGKGLLYELVDAKLYWGYRDRGSSAQKHVQGWRRNYFVL